MPLRIARSWKRLAAHLSKRVRSANNVEPGHVVRWNLQTGERLVTIPGVGESSFAWHPSGIRIAKTDGKGVLRLWDANDGRELLSIPAHGGDRWKSSSDVAFSPDGRWLASSGGEDGTLRFFDRATWREVHSLTPRSRLSAW